MIVTEFNNIFDEKSFITAIDIEIIVDMVNDYFLPLIVRNLRIRRN